jgi:hypothetical protein
LGQYILVEAPEAFLALQLVLPQALQVLGVLQALGVELHNLMAYHQGSLGQCNLVERESVAFPV